MSENKNIYKCLGKSLNDDIKHVSISKFKFFDKFLVQNKDLLSDETTHYFCLSNKKAYIIKGQLEIVIYTFEYEAIDYIQIDNKNETIGIFLFDDKINKILLKTQLKSELVKNIMCQYSLYYMKKYFIVKELRCRNINKIVEVEDVNAVKKKGLHKIFNPINIKNYL